jgi:hypothetical protein
MQLSCHSAARRIAPQEALQDGPRNLLSPFIEAPIDLAAEQVRIAISSLQVSGGARASAPDIVFDR